MSSKIIFFFLDGIGLGPGNGHNPFWVAHMPYLRGVIGGPLISGARVDAPNLLLKGIDACLGVEGIPQSATGQTALFTGVNASKVLGRHLTAYPNERLKKILFEHSILKRALEMGFKSTFANAYDLKRYLKLIDEGMISHSATTQSVIGANLPFRTVDDLRMGKAVYWDITNELLIERGITNLHLTSPETAGRRLAGLAETNDLVLFECFKPDILGHNRKLDDAMPFLGVLDRFLAGILSKKGENVTLVISSDHGNLEDLSVLTHTFNPVPLLVFGPGAPLFKEAESITDLAEIILRAMRM